MTWEVGPWIFMKVADRFCLNSVKVCMVLFSVEAYDAACFHDLVTFCDILIYDVHDF